MLKRNSISRILWLALQVLPLRCFAIEKQYSQKPDHPCYAHMEKRSVFLFKKRFKQSEYYRNWQALLSSPAVSELLEYYDYQLLFYPHHQMQKFVDEFSAGSDRIMIASRDRYEVQQLLIHSDVLITDFSSVFFDYAYMQKPMIYYQFDKEDYREKNYQQGWFRYEKDGFGKVLEDIKMVEVELKKILDRGCTMEKLYWDRQDKMFKYHDHKNCERNYKSIIEKLQNREN